MTSYQKIISDIKEVRNLNLSNYDIFVASTSNVVILKPKGA